MICSKPHTQLGQSWDSEQNFLDPYEGLHSTSSSSVSNSTVGTTGKKIDRYLYSYYIHIYIYIIHICITSLRNRDTALDGRFQSTVDSPAFGLSLPLPNNQSCYPQDLVWALTF